MYSHDTKFFIMRAYTVEPLILPTYRNYETEISVMSPFSIIIILVTEKKFTYYVYNI